MWELRSHMPLGTSQVKQTKTIPHLSPILSSQSLLNPLQSFSYAFTTNSSVGKESTCNAGHFSSIPGSGRSAGEGIGYPLEYSWTSLVAQLVKNPPAMRETWILSLGWEDPLEKEMATHSTILAQKIPMDLEEPGKPQPIGLQRVRHYRATKHSTALHKLHTLINVIKSHRNKYSKISMHVKLEEI